MHHVMLRPEEYRPTSPQDIAQRYGIAIVGCGEIVRYAHLPAYRNFGYRVVAACDIVPENARAIATDFGIPVWTTHLDEVLENPEVAVVDLAVHARQRLPLVERIAAAGKHILSQKPFALSLAEAQQMVDICRRSGVKLMVNQQARWAPAHRALKLLIDRGVLGHLYSVLHLYRDFQDFPGSWFVQMEHATLLDHGIHYIDLSRYFTGRTPQRVKATTTMTPEQRAVTPMIYTILCEYEPDAQLMTTLHFNNIVQTSSLRQFEWFLDGTQGSAWASQSEVVVSLKDTPELRQTIKLQGQWYTDAFGAAMGELLCAIAEDREPIASGQDNLQSLQIAYAAVESSISGRAVDLLSS